MMPDEVVPVQVVQSGWFDTRSIFDGQPDNATQQTGFWWQFRDDHMVQQTLEYANQEKVPWVVLGCTCGGTSHWPTIPTADDCEHTRQVKRIIKDGS